MKKFLLNGVKSLFFLTFGLAILYFVYRGQNAAFQEDCALRGVPPGECSLLDKVVADFAGANYFWILLVLILFIISIVSRAVRWNMLLRPLGYDPRFGNAFWSIVLGYFANLGLPRLGEVLRCGAMAQYERIPVEKVMGTLVVDRIIDIILIILVSVLALALEYDTIARFLSQNVDLGGRFGNGSLLLVVALSGALGLLALILFRRRLARLPFFKKVVDLARGFRDGLMTVRRLERPWLFLMHSLLIWVMYFLMTYLCFFAFAPTAGLAPVVALIVFVFGGWGIVVPSPGGMGTYHFMVQTALQMYGVSGDDAFSWANIAFFSIQLGNNVFLGILSLLVLPALNRNYHPQPVVEGAGGS